MQVLLRREVNDVASRAAGDDHADLAGQRQQLFEHRRRLLQRDPGGGELGTIGNPQLPFAVVAEPRRLQDAGQQFVADRGQLSRGFDQRVRRAGHAAALEMRLLQSPVLAHRHRVGRRCDRAARGQGAQRGGRHVLELGGDGGGHIGEPPQAIGIEIASANMVVRDEAGRAGGIGVEHRGGVAERLRGVDEHAAELAATEHAERRAGSDETGLAAHGGGGGAIVSAAVMARAAAVWRAR